MREFEHEQLFDPPKGTRAIVIPVSGEIHDKGKTLATPMDDGYAKIARSRWVDLPIVVAVLMRQRGAMPHPLTSGFNDKVQLIGKSRARVLPPKFHLISLPLRPIRALPLKVDYVCQKIRELAQLVDGRISWLKEGTIVLPQICDGPDRPWEYWKTFVGPYLDDRFLVISGKKGTVT